MECLQNALISHPLNTLVILKGLCECECVCEISNMAIEVNRTGLHVGIES